ncbi:MAG: AmmeMemoRadiSam system protein A [Bacteroidetes bacterium]|nr:AmmeMemoRadiSam system protein A [Bacteroidota bacterium]
MLASLDSAVRLQLLRTAREAIRAKLERRDCTLPVLRDAPAASGAFVTLHVSGALRGCIGFLELQDGLSETIAEAARRAASSDPRFMPLEKAELDDCSMEITLLGPQERIAEPEDFIIGQHGLTLDYRGRRGLLLPQVPVERGWNKSEFLSALCQKSQAPDRCWMLPDAVLFRFEGLIIRDTDTADF